MSGLGPDKGLGLQSPERRGDSFRPPLSSRHKSSRVVATTDVDLARHQWSLHEGLSVVGDSQSGVSPGWKRALSCTHVVIHV
jgi:hypothetical protein